MRRLVSTAVAKAAILLALPACALLPATAAHAQTTPTTPTTPSLTAAPDPWRLGDDIVTRISPQWNAARGIYMNERGFPETRLNSLLLQLHSMAALAGHTGPSRQDDRIGPMVRVLTSAPVLVARNLRPRATGHFPHAPAWTPLIGENPETAVLHPSIDTAVIRALTAAWRARTVIGMPVEQQQRIAQVLVDLAGSPFYTAPSRALNQINWHAEAYAAALEVAGDTSVLEQYRKQLKWFAENAHKVQRKDGFIGGSPNLTSGGGFRYLPNRPKSAQLNQIETTEYGNLALGSLGFYEAFVRAGMRRLPAAQETTLRQWSRHMLLGSWTQAGYPNWDTGLGTKRRHLRQYWAWALDGLMTASGPDALLGYPNQRAYARWIAERGISLYLARAWTGDMTNPATPLPAKTSFNSPNGFSSGAGNELIGPLRFALLDASLDARFADVPAAQPPNWFARDDETGRLAFSTPLMNGAFLPPRGAQSQGGVEPVRLFDSGMRPITGLGGRGRGTLGVAILRGGVVATDTSPSVPARQRTADVRAVGRTANAAADFRIQQGITGTVRSSAGVIQVRHEIRNGQLKSTYALSRVARGAEIAVRVPVWGDGAQVQFRRGAIRSGTRWLRTSAPLILALTTSDGAAASVGFTGVPANAKIRLSMLTRDTYHPDGGRNAVLTFRAPASGRLTITRTIDVQAGA